MNSGAKKIIQGFIDEISLESGGQELQVEAGVGFDEHLGRVI